MSKKQPKWKTDSNSIFHPKAHTAFLIVCPFVLAIAAGVFALCFAYTYEYLTAPYRAEVQATLVKITEGEQEKWEYIESKKEEPNPNQRATRTYTEKIYGYHWEYTIDGKTHTYETTSSSGSVNKVGDVEKMKFWSRDGEEFYRSYGTGLNYVLMIVSAVFFFAALFIIIWIIIIKIQMASQKRKKELRKAQQKPEEAINLGNFDGKRVLLITTDNVEFEGIGEYHNKDYCEHVFNRREPGLEIANFNFFRSEVRYIENLKNRPYSAPFGKIEELNYEDGADSIEEELFCEEDDHVYRMLMCIEDHAVNKNEDCPELAPLLQNLLQTELSDRTRKKTAELLEHLQKSSGTTSDLS